MLRRSGHSTCYAQCMVCCSYYSASVVGMGNGVQDRHMLHMQMIVNQSSGRGEVTEHSP